MTGPRTRVSGLRLGSVLLSAALAACGLGADGLPPGSPVRHGFSDERLARIDAAVAREVSARRVAGAVTLVARDGRVVHFAASGWRDVESADAMRRDTIFRIASMSKAVTTVAALLLMEDGKLLLTDSVSRFLPAFRAPAVEISPADGGLHKTVQARRQVTIRDLMTHTAGYSYGGGARADAYREVGADLWYFADRDEPIGAVVDRLARVPLEAQPGEKWIYGYSTDILGRVVEAVSGMPLDVFLRTRIFEPLRMPDTSFFLPQEKRSRLAAVYSAGKDGRIERAPQHGRDGQGEYVDGPRACFSGGAGLLSTAADYARFLQMLANGGTLDGVRLLSPKTVAFATRNQVGSLYDEGRVGFGLGFSVVEDPGRSGQPGSIGEYGWGSAYYSRYWVDPSEHLVFLILMQLIPAGELDLTERFHTLVQSALVAPSKRPDPGGGPRAARKARPLKVSLSHALPRPN
ncbi:MAG: beta-lactamase family protein [Acidobacteria bacterium]|nr:beta-lactamase family protein [Acidobacteriota bacterium]MCA1612376.1 beta-lactamase family protein [Acidobacteriota bacterium]